MTVTLVLLVPTIIGNLFLAVAEYPDMRMCHEELRLWGKRGACVYNHNLDQYGWDSL